MENIKFKDIAPTAPDLLSNIAKEFSQEVLKDKSFMNVDLEDMETVLKDTPNAYIAMGVAVGDSYVKILNVIEEMLNNPFLKSRFSETKKVLHYISCSSDVEFSKIELVNDKIFETFPEAWVIWGSGYKDELEDTIKFFLLSELPENVIYPQYSTLVFGAKYDSDFVMTKRGMHKKEFSGDDLLQLIQQNAENYKRADTDREYEDIFEELAKKRSEFEFVAGYNFGLGETNPFNNYEKVAEIYRNNYTAIT